MQATREEPVPRDRWSTAAIFCPRQTVCAGLRGCIYQLKVGNVSKMKGALFP